MCGYCDNASSEYIKVEVEPCFDDMKETSFVYEVLSNRNLEAFVWQSEIDQDRNLFTVSVEPNEGDDDEYDPYAYVYIQAEINYCPMCGRKL